MGGSLKDKFDNIERMRDKYKEKSKRLEKDLIKMTALFRDRHQKLIRLQKVINETIENMK